MIIVFIGSTTEAVIEEEDDRHQADQDQRHQPEPGRDTRLLVEEGRGRAGGEHAQVALVADRPDQLDRGGVERPCSGEHVEREVPPPDRDRGAPGGQGIGEPAEPARERGDLRRR